MDTLGFLKRIWPREGVYLLAVMTDKGLRHKAFESIAAAAEAVEQFDSRGLTVYHACAAYKTKPYKDEVTGKFVNRKEPNWRAARSFWVDIDCGADKAAAGKGYPTQREAAQAFLGWCRKHELPDPMLVSSGGGLHGYWPLEDEMAPDAWVRAASIIKAALAADKVLVGPERTADFASVLRPVGSTHRKDPTRPRSVKLLRDGPTTANAAFLAALQNIVLNNDITVADIPAWMQGVEVDNSALTDHFVQLDSSAERIATQCAQVREMRDTKGLVGYEQWRGVIGIIKHCVEGDALAHEWSSGHRGYDAGETQTKLDSWSAGPATCEFFQRCNPSACEGCAFKGKIKSPIVLGREVPEPKPAAVVEVEASDGAIVKVEVPSLPHGYQWDGRYLARIIKDAQGVPQAFAFCPTLFYLVARVEREDSTFVARGRLHLPDGRLRNFDVKMGTINRGGTALLEELGQYEVILSNHKGAAENMTAYLRDQVKSLMQTQREIRTLDRFGWHEDGILYGDRLYTKDGVTEVILGRRAATKVRAFARPRGGSAKSYADSLNWVYNRPGMEPFQFAQCALWGSLLVPFTEGTYHGIPTILTGPASGKGKTSAFLAGLYAFGDAEAFTIKGESGSTTNARSAILSVFHNFPILFDEITNMEWRAYSELLYAASNGRERERLNRAAGFNEGGTWNVQVGGTGNASVLAKLGLGGDSQAEAMRVFEIRIDQYPLPTLDPMAVSTHMSNMERNAGYAGELYVKYLVENKDKVVELMQDTLTWYGQDARLGSESRYRFHRNLMVCATVALRIMGELGLVNYPLTRFRQFAIQAFASLVGEVQDNNELDFTNATASLMLDLASRIITTTTFGDAVTGTLERHVVPQGLAGRRIKGNQYQSDEHDGTIYLEKRAVTEWCVEHRVDFRALVSWWADENILINENERVNLGRGTTLASGNPRCIVLDNKKLEGDTLPLQAARKGKAA